MFKWNEEVYGLIWYWLGLKFYLYSNGNCYVYFYFGYIVVVDVFEKVYEGFLFVGIWKRSESVIIVFWDNLYIGVNLFIYIIWFLLYIDKI